ncbi:LAFA_0A01244g1_1 [Lachancea sp. 'fantastica']|nr:LAFA_0A01244g1_1 [Lachancea sp. 'fantastica']
MSASDTGIMTLSAMACSAEDKQMETASSYAAPVLEETHKLQLTPLSVSRTSTPSSTSSSSLRRARNFWSVHEDTALVSTVIDNTAILKGSDNSNRPRGRFWLHISFELKNKHGITRNKRQCRDRFNLLFWKAVRDRNTSRGELKRLDALLSQCLTLLYIDKNNVIMLKENGVNDKLGMNHTLGAAPEMPRLTEDTGLHSPAMSMYSSVSDGAPDMGYESLAELASGLQRQVSALTQQVEDLSGLVAEERSRVDVLMKHGMYSGSIGVGSIGGGMGLYPPVTRQEPMFVADACCRSGNGYGKTAPTSGSYTMSPYLLARRD